ncbi:MAG: DHH family phosphoesterase [Candidatus Kariarchaeaceae archaeon]|jgi:nanoRNase/pAp phosphatase (c-di-AMP/oligoRNAs hydrolase)
MVGKLYKAFIDYLQSLPPTQFVILLHHNADPDAICAAEVYGQMFLRMNKKHSYKIYSDDVNQTATRIMKEFNISVLETEIEFNGGSTCFVTVDTANVSQLGKYAPMVSDRDIGLLVIDHHDTSELADEADASIVDTSSSSTCVLADKTLQAADITPNARMATLILSGHMYDSRRMLYGTTSEIMKRFGELIDLGGDFEKANELLQATMSIGERIARFKASQRLKYHVFNDFLVVTSKVGAFEASVARSYIGMGADIALVLAPKGKELRGSARCNLNINIGEVMSELATEFGGTGGGHAAAAGFNISPVPSNDIQKQIQSRFINLVKTRLSQETS